MPFPPAALLVVAVTIWVVADAARRGRNWYGWAGLVAVTGPVGLLVWLVARRRWPVVDDSFDSRRGLGMLLTASPLFLLTILLAVVGVTFLFQHARVEGRAMSPTILDQDRLVVSMLAYRLAEPRIGDIVMLLYPLNPEKKFVKRVVAEEGDQVRIIKGQVYRNDVLMKEPYVAAECLSKDNWGPEVIPEGYYFVMGDCRNNSSDSRHWKYVPKKYILGKVLSRWWPVDRQRRF